MRSIGWGPFQFWTRHRTQEPGATLFQGLRVRLTLWYCGVLCAALILFGVTLYLAAQYALMQPVQETTRSHALMHEHLWQGDDMARDACPMFGQQGQFGPPPHDGDFSIPEIVVCFDQNATLLAGENVANLPGVLINNSLAQQALQSSMGHASGIVDTGAPNGRIYRYAQVVWNQAGGVIGVIVVGEFIRAQDTALATLLTLLLSIGGGALLCAGLGGLFMANRALGPARLAWSNQQRFIADASHELRTPLTLMRADAEVLLRGRQRMDAEDADLLEDIIVEASHMATITTNLLTLARLDSQEAHQEQEVVDLVAVARKVVRRVQSLADQRDITIKQSFIENAYVIGDPVLLEQAALVLLDNAIKYNRPAGSLHVRVVSQDQHVILEVQDSGIGISAEHLPYLGERFYRVDKARSRAAGGTGLGLSIARSIASSHGGQLFLTSQAEQGTLAVLQFPEAREARTIAPRISSAKDAQEPVPPASETQNK